MLRRKNQNNLELLNIFFYICNQTCIIKYLTAMKKSVTKRLILSLLLVFSALFATQVHAQSLRNSSGGYMGKVDYDGTVRNSSGGYAGKIENDGTVRNSSGGYMGKIESDGTVRNSSGGYAGKIENDGTVRNSSGGYMGKIENDGTVRNSSGGYMGKAENLTRKQAAAVFFFFHF